jgi:NAD(P)-dependent dehydrogenase (short-subunit alcohol dehydrogenase family)
MSFNGKIAIVTGAAKGIGKAISLSLARSGVLPVIADVDKENAEKVRKEIEEVGISTMAIDVDVSNVQAIKDMVNIVIERFGTIDILVNNAAIVHDTAIEDIDENEWDRIMAINLKSVFFCSQQVLPYMKKKRWGRIINMSSIAGRMGGYAGGLGYTASKAGIIGLTMGFARRVADYNITVNAIAPGPTKTEILKNIPEDRMAKVIGLIPLKRLGRPENIAETVAFLVSDGADFITGAIIDVNGGIFMG